MLVVLEEVQVKQIVQHLIQVLEILHLLVRLKEILEEMLHFLLHLVQQVLVAVAVLQQQEEMRYQAHQ